MSQSRHSLAADRSELPLGLRFVVVLVVGATLMLLLMVQLRPGAGTSPVQRIVPAQEASAPQLETWTEEQGALQRDCSRAEGCGAWRDAA